MNRGFVILAQNNQSTDYVFCAHTLCKNIKSRMPEANVTLVTDRMVDKKQFDHVVLFPHGDQCSGTDWKLANDWQIYEASPYEYTIKLEADMYLPRSVDHWWDTLQKHDLVLMQQIRNFTNQISDVKFYRRFIVDNNLPDVYNAITYFKKSPLAQTFFHAVRDIFAHWDDYMQEMKKVNQDRPTTDYVYALAAHIVGVENCTLPGFDDFSMIHMKQMINSASTEVWTDQFVYEIMPETIRINTIPQLYPLHYHIKNFAHELSSRI